MSAGKSPPSDFRKILERLSGEYWAAWSNIHYIAPWLPFALRNQTPEAQAQGQPPPPLEVERIQVSLGQQEFAL